MPYECWSIRHARVARDRTTFSRIAIPAIAPDTARSVLIDDCRTNRLPRLDFRATTAPATPMVPKRLDAADYSWAGDPSPNDKEREQR